VPPLPRAADRADLAPPFPTDCNLPREANPTSWTLVVGEDGRGGMVLDWWGFSNRNGKRKIEIWWGHTHAGVEEVLVRLLGCAWLFAGCVHPKYKMNTPCYILHMYIYIYVCVCVCEIVNQFG
jgi:hypothetical protein